MGKRKLDDIQVVKLPKQSNISSGWPQQYKITVVPCEDSDYAMPDLPMLHKGDGITAPDGDAYLIEWARQVPVPAGRGGGYIVWTWVYTATRDTSNDPQERGL